MHILDLGHNTLEFLSKLTETVASVLEKFTHSLQMSNLHGLYSTLLLPASVSGATSKRFVNFQLGHALIRLERPTEARVTHIIAQAHRFVQWEIKSGYTESNIFSSTSEASQLREHLCILEWEIARPANTTTCMYVQQGYNIHVRITPKDGTNINVF